MYQLPHILIFLFFITQSSTSFGFDIDKISPPLSKQNQDQETDQEHNPYQILMSHYEAMGGLINLINQKTQYTSGKVTFSGMTGTFQSWFKNKLQYRQEIDYPEFSTIEGDDGKQMWTIDLNKKILILKDEKTRKNRRLRALLNNFENLNPQSQFFKLRYQGIEDVKGKKCYVIETKNSLNKDVYYDYFSVVDFLLLKSVTQESYLKYVTHYSDFKQTGKILSPFYSQVNISPTGKEIIMQIDKLVVNGSIADDKFSIPDNDVIDYQFENNSSANSIPFLLSENNIYIPVRIQGREHYWVLDSGADISVIDANYANRLNLKSFGALSGNATSSLINFNYVKLNSFNIKGIKFTEQTILSYQGLADNFYEPDAVGILGYDFLSRFITKIDYANQLISFIQPNRFSYKGSGCIIDAPLQDKFFMIPMTIDGKYKGNYGLDLGSFNVSMNYPFAKKNGFMDKQGILRLSSDISGSFYEKQYQPKSLNIAGYELNNELVSFPIGGGKGTNSDEKIDGLLGNSLLRHFILYLDYAKQQLIFEKGKNFNKNFPVDKSGMIVGRSTHHVTEIFYIANNTPAYYCGLKVGDIIKSIDNLQGGALPNSTEITKMLRANSGTKYKLIVNRGKQELVFSLVLENLYQ